MDLCPERITAVSLCSGGGGLDLGIRLALPAFEPVCLVEREAFAAARLVAAMQDGLMAPAPVWSDVATFRGRPWRGAVDFVVGGIPCQPHSVAGRKRGSHDARDLWSDARRIIAQTGAWGVLIENVAGMLSAGADEIAGAERVWRDLQRMGFAVEGGLFSASEVGAPHERQRLFILGLADANHPRLAVRQSSPGCGRSLRVEGSPPVESGGPGLVHPGLGELPLWPPRPSDIDGWRHVARHAPDLLPALSRYDLFRAALRAEGFSDDGLPGQHRPWSGSERGADAELSTAHALRPVGVSPPTESALRLLAHGLGNRVDDLRLSGNGVVSLVAALAFRTLLHRLAGRSERAAGLVRMMQAGALQPQQDQAA